MELVDGKSYRNSNDDVVRVKLIKEDSFKVINGLHDYIVNQYGKYTIEGDFDHPYDLIEEVEDIAICDSNRSLYTMCINISDANVSHICDSIPSLDVLSKYMLEKYEVEIEKVSDYLFIITNEDNSYISFTKRDYIIW